MQYRTKQQIERDAIELHNLGIPWDEAMAEASKPAHPLKEQTFRDLMDAANDERGWLIGDAKRPVLLADALWMAFGPEKGGKTYSELEKAFCIAFGLPYYGLPVQQGNIEYVIAEGGIGRIAKRVFALCEKYREPLAAMGLDTWEKIIDAGHFNLMASPLNLIARDDSKVENSIRQMIAQMRHPPYVGVWLDTWSRMLAEAGSHASDADTVALALRGCDDIRNRLGCTVIQVAHTPLGDKGRPKGMNEQTGNLDGATLCRKLGRGTGEVFTFTSEFQRHAMNGFTMTLVQKPVEPDRVFEAADGEFSDSELAMMTGAKAERARGALAILRSMEPGTSPDAWRDAAISAGVCPGKNPRQQWSDAVNLILSIDAVVIEHGMVTARKPKAEPKGEALIADADD